MKKILLALILMFTFSAGMVTAKTTAINGLFDGYQIVKLFSNGKEIEPDKIPGINYKGNTLIPIGSLRSLGVLVAWNGEEHRVDITLPTRTVPVLTQPQLEELSKYVYKVYGSTDDPTIVKQGSGFIVNGIFITNYHVAGDSATASVLIDGQTQKVSEYSFANKDVDLMGFKVTGGKSLPTSTKLPQVSDPVYAIGFPHGQLKITKGEVINIIQQGRTGVEIVHSARVDGGNSGGFLLNGNGEVIGVNESGYEDTGYAIPISYALDQMKGLQ